MLEDPKAAQVAYARPGAIRPRRGANWFAIVSLAIGLILALGNMLLMSVYKSQPKQGGWEGLGWFFAMMGVLGVVMTATYIGAPIGLLCAIVAILQAREQPRGRANSLIAISLLLLVGDLGFVIFAHTYADRELDRASTPAPVPVPASPPKVYTETDVGWQLAQYCQMFSAQHDGDYPQSLQEVYGLVKAPETLGLMRKCDFYYVGAGLRITDRSDPAISRVIILISNERQSNGSRVLIGIDGAVTKVSSIQELTNVIERNNEVRQRHHWPQVSYTPDE